jgi:hypothetical protein
VVMCLTNGGNIYRRKMSLIRDDISFNFVLPQRTADQSERFLST